MFIDEIDNIFDYFKNNKEWILQKLENIILQIYTLIRYIIMNIIKNKFL